MAEALTALRNTQGLIIDMRLNPGGEDGPVYNLAGRFTDSTLVGHYKQTRKRGKAELTNPKPTQLKPKGPWQYTRPVVVLTSSYTASAAEVFVMAVQQLPHVTTMGQATTGAMSWVWKIKLKHKWVVTNSYQQAFDANMLNYEGKGIPPDHAVPLPPATNTSLTDDPVLTEAVKLLMGFVENE